MNDDFRVRVGEYAELRGCMAALNAGADRSDELVHLRQIARRIAESGRVFGDGLISADVIALEDLLVAEAAEREVVKAIDTLLAHISGDLGDRQEPAELVAESAKTMRRSRTREAFG